MSDSSVAASVRPERRLSGRSIWVTSPVITAFDSKPRRVRNIFICSRGRVLGLVEDDERVVQRPAAHEGDGRDLDQPAGHQLVGLLEVHHVVERVVERAQVGRDLLLHAAGQEARAARPPRPPGRVRTMRLTCFSIRDADRQGHRQVGLAGAGRPDAEDDVVGADGVDVALLRQPLGGDGPRAAADQDGVVKDLAQVDAARRRAARPPRGRRPRG